MAESTYLVDLVQSRIDNFLITREPIVTLISSDLTPLITFSRQFLSGGKRFRALFCYRGWQSVVGEDSPGSRAGVVSTASALEIFHAAALVHDDIIDNSDTRRGSASAHKLFEGVHERAGWAGGPVEFGRASGILMGDLLLGWSDELLDEGLAVVEDVASARLARAEFNRMRTEVTLGQYLDILEERAWLTHAESEHLDRALRVVVYKSAKYSVQAPLVIGAALGGASVAELDSLRAFGLPLGMAFQLRDDLLGVFGDAAVTGKPSGDDLREGKRTVLIALARATLAPGPRALLDANLGDPELDEERIRALQRIIIDTGAVDRVEAMITAQVTEAIIALDSASLRPEATERLRELAQTVTRRVS